MKKPSSVLRGLLALVLVSPFAAAWIPAFQAVAVPGTEAAWRDGLLASFRQLSITLGATLAVASAITAAAGYVSVLSMPAGRIAAGILEATESIPAILIALFCYAPVSGYLAMHGGASSSVVSLFVFVFAATVTALPESVRGIAIPLGELYHRKYSLSFRSYGFRRDRILAILMASRTMRDAMKRVCAGILLKTLVLDCSFGFIIQLGFGSYGTPAHASPGALIAANRDALFEGGNPLLFWLPVIPLVMVSLSFLIMLGGEEEEGV